MFNVNNLPTIYKSGSGSDCYNVGKCHEAGEGLLQDDGMAAYWFYLSAQRTFLPAKLALIRLSLQKVPQAVFYEGLLAWRNGQMERAVSTLKDADALGIESAKTALEGIASELEQMLRDQGKSV